MRRRWTPRFGGRTAGAACPPLDLVAPPLITAELGEVAALLVRAVGEVYGEELPFPALVDAFSHFRLARWFFRSRFGVKKLAARGVDAALGKPHYALSHTQPRKLLPGVPGGLDRPVYRRGEAGRRRLPAGGRGGARGRLSGGAAAVLGRRPAAGRPCPAAGQRQLRDRPALLNPPAKRSSPRPGCGLGRGCQNVLCPALFTTPGRDAILSR